MLMSPHFAFEYLGGVGKYDEPLPTFRVWVLAKRFVILFMDQFDPTRASILL